MANEKSKRGDIPQRDVASFIAMFTLMIVYFAGGWSQPDYPYDKNMHVIYPIFVFYKSFPTMQLVLSAALMLINGGLLIRVLRYRIARVPVAIAILFVLVCSVHIGFMYINITASERYRHDVSITYRDHRYHAGLSSGEPIPTYINHDVIVFKCDVYGILCEQYPVYYTTNVHPDEVGRRARFHQAENDGWIHLRYGERGTFPMFCNESPGRPCGSIE